jgi:hypothetical protein
MGFFFFFGNLIFCFRLQGTEAVFFSQFCDFALVAIIHKYI